MEHEIFYTGGCLQQFPETKVLWHEVDLRWEDTLMGRSDKVEMENDDTVYSHAMRYRGSFIICQLPSFILVTNSPA